MQSNVFERHGVEAAAAMLLTPFNDRAMTTSAFSFPQIRLNSPKADDSPKRLTSPFNSSKFSYEQKVKQGSTSASKNTGSKVRSACDGPFAGQTNGSRHTVNNALNL